MSRKPALLVLVGAVAGLALLMTSAVARGYVRTTATDGKGLAWPQSCMRIVPDSSFSQNVSAPPSAPGSVLAAIQASAAAWREATQSCAYFHMEIDAPESGVEVGNDQRNIIIWREERWCRPALGNEAERCYDPNAAAITTIFFIDDASSRRDGEILDADIEINGVNFRFTTSGEAGGTDVQDTLTHEMGHVMGLDHTCWDGHSPRTRPKDGDGRPVPSCSEALPAEVTEATMYPHAQPGDSRRTPSTDDVAGICSVYPLANDPGVCQPNQPNLPSACLTDIPCISDLQCVSVPGTSCNQALAAPRCQKVQCGEAGSPCSAEGQCLVGALCVGGVCSIPAKGCSVGAATACERSGRRLLLASGTVVFLVSLLSLRVRRPRRSK